MWTELSIREKMNFLTVVVLLQSTLLATNEIDNVNGMDTNTEGRSPNQSKSLGAWKSGSRSYLAAFEKGPRPPESKVEKGAPSKQALINQKKRERKKMRKANGESSSAPSTPSTLGRSPEDESASTFPAIIKESSPLSSPSPSSSKSEPRQNKKSSTLGEESAVDESIEDESVTDDYPSLSSRAFKLAKKKYPSDSKTTETTVEGRQGSPEKKFTGSPPERAEKMSFFAKTTGQKELRDELAFEVMSSRPTNGNSQEVHRLARFQSRESAATKPRNSENQKKEEPSVELTTQDRKVLEVDKTKPDIKEIQDESIAPASTSRATHDNKLEKIDQKSTDTPIETQSLELAKEQPTHSETEFSPTNTSQKESAPNEPVTQATPPTDIPRSDGTAKFDDRKRQPYQPKNPPWKALKGFEEVPPPPNSSPRGRTWRQSHHGTVEGSSKAETWKQKQDMLRRAHAAPHESPPYQFINKEKYLAKTKSDNSRGNQSSVQNGKNVWQQKEPQKLEKDERTQDDSPKPSYLRILSRQTDNPELERNETIDKEGPAQREIDGITPKGCEDNKDLQREEKLEGDSSLLGQNKDESANAAGTSLTNEVPRTEAGGPPSVVDDEGEKCTKIEESPASPQRVITLSSPIDIPNKRIEMRKMSKEEALESLVRPTNDIDSTASTTSTTQFRLSDDEEKHEDTTSGTLPQTESKEEVVGTELKPTVDEQTRPSEKIPSIAGTTVTTVENEVESTQPNADIAALGKEDTNLDEIPEGFSSAPPPSNITPPQMQKSDSLNSEGIEGEKGEAAKSVPISVTPRKSPQNLLSFLKDVGIFNSEEANQQNDTSNHMTADPSENPSLGADEGSPTEITDTPHRSHALGRRKPTNALLITCITHDALTRLELSAINPMAFGATDIVTLRGSGVIVKFDSSDGVQDLLKAMLDAEDISSALHIRSIYIFEHLLCVHHIPEDVQQLQIVYRLRSQYNQEPIRVQFVSYIIGVHRGYKLALIDVGDSLLNEIEKNPLIQVRWMLRRIDVCLSPHRGKFPPEMNMYNPQTPYPIVHDAVIVKIPADISKGELNDSMYKKYGERPFDTHFKPYFRQNHMKMGQLTISETLLGKIYLSPYVQIRWSERLIITKVDLYRCTKCQRIGHLRYNCKGEERPESHPHENCVDCSSNTAHPQNNVHHQTDSAECPVKLQYVLRCLAEQRAATLRSTMGSVPGPNQGWISQPAVRPFPQQSHGQISPFNRGVLPSSSFSNPPPQFRSTVGSVPGPNQGWISQPAVRPLPHRSRDQISPSSKGILSSSPLSSSPLSNPPQFRSTARSVPGPSRRWISQPVVRSFQQQSQDQISPSNMTVYSSSPLSNPSQLPRPTITISAPPNGRIETLLETASSSSKPRNDTPEHAEVKLAVPAEEHEADERDEASPNSIPELPEMESDIPDTEHILNEQDIRDIIESLSLPTDTIDELIPDETASPGPPPHHLKKQIIFEAVRKSVYETLQEALPKFYEIILEAVDRSVTETLNRLLPPKSNKFTPSASFKTCDSGDLSSLPSDDPTENKELGKGKEKVGRDDTVERTPSPLDPGQWYDEKHIVLVAGKSKQVNVFEELAKINIDWRQACIERPVIYPFERILLVCNSTEGAKYLRSVLKKSPTLKVLM